MNTSEDVNNPWIMCDGCDTMVRFNEYSQHTRRCGVIRRPFRNPYAHVFDFAFQQHQGNVDFDRRQEELEAELEEEEEEEDDMGDEMEEEQEGEEDTPVRTPILSPFADSAFNTIWNFPIATSHSSSNIFEDLTSHFPPLEIVNPFQFFNDNNQPMEDPVAPETPTVLRYPPRLRSLRVNRINDISSRYDMIADRLDRQLGGGGGMFDDYDFNLMLANVLGKVEIGVDNINNVTTLETYECCENSEADICPICQDEYKDNQQIRRTTCNHTFCEDCIGTWLKKNVKCPICMKELQTERNSNKTSPSAIGPTNQQLTNQ